MYEIKVKWPDGREITQSGFTDEQSVALVNFLWAAGADDVKRVCTCGTCETCTDRATYYDLEG